MPRGSPRFAESPRESPSFPAAGIHMRCRERARSRRDLRSPLSLAGPVRVRLPHALPLRARADAAASLAAGRRAARAAAARRSLGDDDRTRPASEGGGEGGEVTRDVGESRRSWWTRLASGASPSSRRSRTRTAAQPSSSSQGSDRARRYRTARGTEPTPGSTTLRGGGAVLGRRAAPRAAGTARAGREARDHKPGRAARAARALCVGKRGGLPRACASRTALL